MTPELQLLLATAAGIGVLHTVLGPDHYLPFAALASSRQWSLAKTLGVVTACGLGHVAGSVLLGAVGIAAGAALSEMVAIEALRGELAAWLLIGFGIAYALWGLKIAWRSRPHAHRHAHVDGVVHEHRHSHHGAHVHVHAHVPAHVHTQVDASGHAHPDEDSAAQVTGGQGTRTGLTPWVLFLVFIFGPCEALIPVLMVPAAQGSWWGVAAVCLVFAVATLGTMLVAVTLIVTGLSRFDPGHLQRYTHVAAGLTLAVCGLAIRLGL